jgi:integrase
LIKQEDYYICIDLILSKSAKKEVVFLSVDELKSLEEYKFSQPRLEDVKNMFIFCCYSGLAYAEMKALEEKHINIGFDGLKWINMERKKTGRVINIPLLPKALEILKLYEKEDLLLPVISNQRFNSYLKEIASIVGIGKRLTHHIARKTFASTVLLYNNVPMEIVSELLGHSNMSITQEYYGKVVMKKVSEEIKKLNGRI